MVVKEVGNNTFLFQFFREIDLNRILEDGYWSFEQSLLVLSKTQPDVPALAMELNKADF